MSNIRLTVKDDTVEITTDSNAYLVLRVDVVSGLLPQYGPSTPLLFLRPGESLRCQLVLPPGVPVREPGPHSGNCLSCLQPRYPGCPVCLNCLCACECTQGVGRV